MCWIMRAVSAARDVVFRMSCIYGPRQCGNEDQGWVAHFLMRALAGEHITIYGDGMQVRDILFVDDLLDAFRLAMSAYDPSQRDKPLTSAEAPRTPLACWSCSI